MTLRCAILDDYQNVALKMADWSALRGKLDVTVFDRHLGAPHDVVRALADFDIICAMRERTLLSRETLEKLPKLKLLITSAMHNAAFDIEAAKQRGILASNDEVGTVLANELFNGEGQRISPDTVGGDYLIRWSPHLPRVRNANAPTMTGRSPNSATRCHA